MSSSSSPRNDPQRERGITGADHRGVAASKSAPGKSRLRSFLNPLKFGSGRRSSKAAADPGAAYHAPPSSCVVASTSRAKYRFSCPRDLGAAVDAFEADPLAKEVFGDAMHKAWVTFKKAEWDDYCRHVSEWEVSRYLRQFG